MYGLSEENLNRIINIILKCDSVSDIIIYGSRAMGTFRNGSDIDLSLKGEIGTKELFQIINDLDDLNLPYEIDLNIFNRIENEDLREHIDRVGVSLIPIKLNAHLL